MLSKSHVKITGNHDNYSIYIKMSHRTLEEIESKFDEIVSDIQKCEKESEHLTNEKEK